MEGNFRLGPPYEWYVLLLVVVDSLHEHDNGRAEEELVHVLQLVLFLWESVHIVCHMVHILVGLEVEVNAIDCGWHLTWYSS